MGDTQDILRISVEDRLYRNYQVSNAKNSEPVDFDYDPVKGKLFNQDIFKINLYGNIEIVHSSLRSMPSIPAILVVEGNRIYGKSNNNRPLYRCIPDDRRMPEFLVPYTIKMKFNKKIYNKYVVFKFNNWNKKHPEGRLVNVLGDVSVLDNFYEYQLYCKSLYASIQDFTKKTMRELKTKSEAHFIDKIITDYNVVDRRTFDIISIDPAGSKDFDDAFGLVDIDGDTILLSIYISNVSLWMDALDLWDSFSQRISTIYLPDRKDPCYPQYFRMLYVVYRKNEQDSLLLWIYISIKLHMKLKK